MAPPKRGTIAMALMVISLLSFLVTQILLPHPASRILVKCSKTRGDVILPVWTRINIWDLSMAPVEKPTPFVREVVLMTATGGRSTCEMFHLNGSGPAHYDFSKIDIALDKVLGAGLLPTIVLGNTPEDLSDSPREKGAFNANIGAPRDYEVYERYMQALFRHLVDRYGAGRVVSWGFRLMTEPDNKDWWKGGRLEYQKLYDYTVAAARSVGADIVVDGGNFMVPVGTDAWTSLWCRWISSNENPIVPKALPRRVDRLGFSCYARGQMGMDPRELGRIADTIRDECSLGEGVKLSVDEGQILHDEDGKYLWLGDGTELGAAWNAAIVKVCLDHRIDRYVQWGFLTDGVKTPTYNVIALYEKMLGSRRLVVNVKNGGLPKGSYLDSLAATDRKGDLRILIFHYNPDRYLLHNQRVKLAVKNLSPGRYNVTHWRVDSEHSNFFSQWLRDSEGIPRMDTGSNSGSIWDLAATSVIGKAGWELWSSRKPHYLMIDRLESLETPRTIQIRGDYSQVLSLPVNSVSLLEFRKLQ